MTSGAARTTANVVLAAAGLAAAYVVLTTPPLRRLVIRTACLWLGTTVPAYLLSETRQAWMASGRAA
ncbi:MAG TPA: hypothetical protein VGY57_02895 [Vicinamibacterales bacterium]|nr:hypothetical protein [Vicinamibacterales bacterium]